jgi:uncharacterized protein
MIDKIRLMILELCAGKDWDWRGHIESVVKYSKILAKKLDADEEIVELAAWLHDIKKIKGEKEQHHIRGAEEAGEILKGLGYPQNRIEKVCQCILTHSSDKKYPPMTKEERILASADAISHFFNFAAIAYGKYHQKGLGISEGKNEILRKYQECWEKIMPEARYLVEERYSAIKLILGST